MDNKVPHGWQIATWIAERHMDGRWMQVRQRVTWTDKGYTDDTGLHGRYGGPHEC